MESQKCSKRKWLVYIASCLVAMIDFPIVLTFGSMFVHLLDRFGENRTTTATVQSILLGTTTTASVVSGILVKKFGTARVSIIGTVCLSGGFIFSFFANSILLLDVFIGAIGGIGVSLLYVSSTVVARNSFEGKTREIAVSAHNVCVGIGSILYPVLLSKLTSTYTVNDTYLILGGIFLNNIAISIVLFTNENVLNEASITSNKEAVSKDSVTCETEDTIDNKARTCKSVNICLVILWTRIVTLLHLRYTLVLFGAGLVLASNSSYLIVCNDIYVWKGFTNDDSVLLLMVFHALGTVGRALPLFYSKLVPSVDIMILLTLCAFSGCIGQMFILFSTTVGFALVGNVFSGLTQGGVICAATVAVAKYSTQELFGVAFGLLFTLFGVLTLSLGPIYGYIRDSIQSYEIAIILTATVCSIGAMLFAAAPIYELIRRKIQSKRQFSLQKQLPSPETIVSLSIIARHNTNEKASIDNK